MVMVVVVVFPVILFAIDEALGPVPVGAEGGGRDGAEEEQRPLEGAVAAAGGGFVVAVGAPPGGVPRRGRGAG